MNAASDVDKLIDLEFYIWCHNVTIVKCGTEKMHLYNLGMDILRTVFHRNGQQSEILS